MIRQVAGTTDAEVREGLAWVRTDTLATLLVCTGGVLWLWLLTFLRQPDQFWPGWGTLGLLVVVVCVCFFLRQRYYLAAWLFSSALFAGATTAIAAAGGSDFPAFLYLPVVLLAGALLGPFACLVFAFGATVSLLIVPVIQGAAIPGDVLAAAIPLLWLAGLVAWASSRNLLTALHWAWSTSRLAEQHLREARASQAQLAAAKRQLEDANYRLGRVNVALSWARREAEEAGRIKTQFAAHVRHELRTPINLVVGFAELMRDYPEVYGDVALPPAYLADLTALFRSAKHLKSLIDDILDLSQLDAGQGSTFAFALPIAAPMLVDGWSGPPMPGRSDPAEPRRRADPTVIVLDEDAAVVGLFRRHLEGYRVLPAGSPAEAATLAAATRAHAVLVDAALGAAERLQRQLEAIGGATSVRVLACPMPSGRRQARTLGVVDYLVKPVDRESLLASLSSVAPNARRVLVVDDQPDMVSLLCRMLRSAPDPFQLLRAFSGEQAMEQLRAQAVDVVLLDLLMPEMDGFAVLDLMRREPALALVPVIAVSAKGAFDPLAPSMARALTLVSDQPFAVGELLRIVQITLDALPPAPATTAELPAAAPGGSGASG